MTNLAAPAPVVPGGLRLASLVRAAALLTLLALLAIAFRPAAHVFDTPLTEDGYYSLAVARNLAAGHGLTIDGTTLTNGFQPLFTMVEALAFWLARGNEILALRLVTAFAWAFHAAGAILVGLIVKESWPVRHGDAERALRLPLAMFLYLAAPLMLNHAYNGLETACVMAFYAACWRVMQTSRDESWGGLALFGALIGLMVLARIDAAFLALILGLNELRRAWSRGPATMLARAALMGGVALAISSPWWIYNTVYFGSPMPTSGTAQQDWALEWLRLEYAEWALRLVAVPWIFAGAHEGIGAVSIPWPFGAAQAMDLTPIGTLRLLVLIAVAVFILRAVRRGQFRDAPSSPAENLRVHRTLEFAACFALALIGLILYYALSFTAYWFFYRYFAPAALFAFVIAPILWARLATGPTTPACRLASIGLVSALTVQIMVLAVLSQSGRGIGGNTVYHDQVALAREYVPAGERVAAGQTGTLGYFRERVVNLDGKVNVEALKYQTHMWDYLREKNIRYFIDWPHYANKYLGVPIGANDVPAAEHNGWRRIAERNYFYVYEYVGDKK